MRWRGLVLVLVACKSTSSGSVAVGWTGTLPTWQGPCRPDTLAPGGVLERAGTDSYVARAAGTAEVECRDGTVALHVRAPTALVIEQVGPLSLGHTHVLRAHLADGKGELLLGDTPISWSLPPGLREIGHCNDMGFCAGAQSIRVVADGPRGDAVVTARYDKLESQQTFRIE